MRGLVWVVVVVAVVALPLAVAWPLGGLETAEKTGPPRVDLGETVTGNRVTITPLRATFSRKDPAPRFDEGTPGRYLALDTRMTNISDETTSLNDLYRTLEVRVDGVKIDPITDSHARIVLRDDNSGELLHPAMPEKVRWAWKVPEKSPDPKSITVSISDEEYKPSFSLLGYQSGTSLWYKSDVIAVLEAPLER